MRELRKTRLVTALVSGSLLAGCASNPSSTGAPGTPTPAPNNPAPGGTPTPTRGGFAYAPVHDAAYALERHDSLTIQLPGGASQQQLIDRTAYLRVSLLPDTTGYVATIVLDSVQASVGGVAAAPDSVLPARGTRWTGHLGSDGRLAGLKADRTTTVGDQVGSTLRSLFPSLPSGGATSGMSWTDTTEAPVRADAFDAIEQSVTSYRSSDSDDPRAKKALKLESTGQYQRTGKGTQYDQQMEMKASGSRKATHYVNPDGTLAGGHGSDSGELTITIPAVGQTVPVKQTGTFSITALRPAKR
jgi:hypothetical protein